MQDIYEEIVHLHSNGGTAALATVVAVKGSTPRAEGSRMLVRADGSILGSIGGGCVEASVWQAAKKIIGTRTAQMIDYDLTGREETPEGLICGGTMQIFIEPVPLPGSGETLAQLLRLKNEGDEAALATVIQKAGSKLESGSRLLISEGSGLYISTGDKELDAFLLQAGRGCLQERTPKIINLGALQFFVEPVFPQPAVYIFGAGHIGFAVSKIARLADFRVVVVDDRPAYANKERFPDAEEFYVEDPAGAVAHLRLNRASYAVIACRGHLEDQRVLQETLKTPAGYIGMIGSRKKTKTVFTNLIDLGVSEKELKRIHAPIGLPIATETPEEIAVSIMAEIIDIRRKGKKVNRSTDAG